MVSSSLIICLLHERLFQFFSVFYQVFSLFFRESKFNVKFFFKRSFFIHYFCITLLKMSNFLFCCFSSFGRCIRVQFWLHCPVQRSFSFPYCFESFFASSSALFKIFCLQISYLLPMSSYLFLLRNFSNISRCPFYVLFQDLLILFSCSFLISSGKPSLFSSVSICCCFCLLASLFSSISPLCFFSEASYSFLFSSFHFPLTGF